MFLKTRLACSFCGKSTGEVSKLVAGPKVYICDVCVAIANHIMNDSDSTTTKTHTLSLTLWLRFVGWLSRLLCLLGWPRSDDPRALFAAR
jgi:uncharacterized protein (DUF983 family)